MHQKNQLVTLLFLSLATLLSAAGDYKIIASYPATGDGGWDYVSIDSGARRVYLGHGTQINVMDADSGKEVGVIGDTPGVHGAAIAPKLKRGFTSNGRENKMSVFDTTTLKVSDKVDVGQGPDAIYYDEASNRVFTTNHGSHDITAVDASTLKVVGTIKVDGDGEAMVTGPRGLIYLGIEDKAEVVAFDPKTLEIKHHFPLTGAETPTGFAVDNQNGRLFIGCRSKNLVVMNAADGTIVQMVPIGTGVDATTYDAVAHVIFVSNGDGTLNVIRQLSADKYEPLQPVTTKPGAKTMAFDPKTQQVYLTTAEFDLVPNTDPSKRPQRKLKPGTFQMLVVGK